MRSATVGCQTQVEAEGASRREKDRLTLVMRQKVSGFFFKNSGSLPTGSVLPSILIVPCAQQSG